MKYFKCRLNQPLQHSTKLICAHARFYLHVYSDISVLKKLLNYLKKIVRTKDVFPRKSHGLRA